MRGAILPIIATISLSFAQASWAEQTLQTISDIKNDRAASSAFKAMRKDLRLPIWVTRGVESQSRPIMLGGKRMLVMSTCQPHNCNGERLAVLYDPERNVMYGLLSIVDANTGVERLTWMNIGGGDESIDGRTILYATLAGSVDNHPDAFNFK